MSTQSTESKQAPAVANGAAAAPSGVEDVIIDVTCEVGRLALSISRISQLAAGQVFDTHRLVDGDCVVLRCAGRKIALGQLVRVAERVAVRITQVLPQPDIDIPLS